MNSAACFWAISCGLLLTTPLRAESLLDQGQRLIDKGKYHKAIAVFSQYIDQYPTEVDGYRGRIEAELMLRRYSDCVRDYALVTAKVIPLHPDASEQIYLHYELRLQTQPNDLNSLMGLSFAHWWYFEYPKAIHQQNKILKLYPNNRYALLMRASSRLLSRHQINRGLIDLYKAIDLDPNNPHVHFIAADAYTYGERDFERAFEEAQLAMAGGLDTPRLHAILAVCYANFGQELLAAEETLAHITMVTTNYVQGQPLEPGDTGLWTLVPGDTIVIPLDATAGESLSITTDGPTGEVWDTILVLLAPDGTPVVSADDVNAYYAALDWTAPVAGTYQLMVTSFESVQSGDMTVTRR